MRDLLARFASNIFWLGRYLERAESLARILDINETYSRDNPAGPDWQRVLDLYSDAARYGETHDTVTAAGVLNFYVLDRANPSSITSVVAAARRNARSVRHLISTEMWTALNIFHNQCGKLGPRDVTLGKLSPLCTRVKLECQTIEGIVEGTLLRDEAWRFFQLGKYIERADQTTRVLDIGYTRLAGDDEEARVSVHWNTLLRSLAGYHAYRSRHPSGSYGADLASFLLYDREFPRAVALCMDRVSEGLKDLDRRHGGARHENIEEARRAVEFALETGPGKRITTARLHRFLDELQAAIGRLSVEIGRSYFLNL